MNRITIVVAAAVACAWCMGILAEEKTVPPPYDKSISDAQALDIAEVTFRYQFPIGKCVLIGTFVVMSELRHTK